MSARLEGGAELNRRLQAIKEAKTLLRELQVSAVAESKALVPRKTGHLAQTIHPGSLGPTFAIVEASANYAAYVELGTKPHTIRPKNASVLAWPANSSDRRLSGRARTKGGKRSGPSIFAKVVHHPGTKPHPYLLPGAVNALKRVGITPIIEAWNKAA